MATAQVFIGYDPASPCADFSAMAVVERVFDRWQMGDIWLVEFDAFDPCTGTCTRDTEAFSSYAEAFSFQPGSLVSPTADSDVFNDELPF